jgi:hypothetical protein
VPVTVVTKAAEEPRLVALPGEGSAAVASGEG